jgi:NADH-quinone oxidoreductase subunit G
MVVRTTTEAVKSVQDGVLEFLLLNHPLDCPVCDRGGECPLQDQTLAFGPGESRYVDEKRHFEKPIAISELVMLDRERCIQCGRCTRFASELAGDALIDFGGRGAVTEVITYPDEPFSSYFSGNTVQICPVGALTSRPYRFRARPWDLDSVETSCQTCSVACRGALESTSNRLVRLLGVDSEPVNHGWLCDKGRYGYEWVHSDARVRAPGVRRGTALEVTSWPQALDAAAAALRRVRDEHGPASIGVLGGALGTNEDAYAWARLAKGVLRTDNVDSQLGDGLPADVVLGMPRATIADLDRARAIVLLGADLKEELPVLYLRARRAAVDLDVPLIDIAARDHGLTPYAAHVLRHSPGVVDEVVNRAIATLDGIAGDGPVVVVLGRSSVAELPDATVRAASRLAGVAGARFLSALPRANAHGALDLGLTPGFLPGRVTLDAGRDHVSAVWGGAPDAPGLDAEGILRAAADGRIKALVLVGCDLLADFPDRALARAALAAAERVVCVGAFPDDATERADVFLPTTVWGEEDGSTTNLEGRVMVLRRTITPEGLTMEAWRIAAELAARLDSEWRLDTVADVQDEIAHVAPAFAGVDAALLRRARDGVVLPLADHVAEVTFAPAPPAAGVSWEPLRPTADEPGDGDGTAKPSAPPVALHVWSADAPAPAAAPIDAYALRLVAGRTLYGNDRVTSASPSLAALAEHGARLLVSRRDRERIGVEDGTTVRVISPHASLDLPLHTDASTPEGVGFLAVNRDGSGAAELIDLTVPVTDVRVETLK